MTSAHELVYCHVKVYEDVGTNLLKPGISCGLRDDY